MAKSAIQINQVIPLNSTVNVLQAKRFENVARTGLLTLAHTGSADGLNAELYVSDRNSLEQSPVGAANRVPILPDDIAVDDVDAFQGERVQLNVTNTTGVDITYQAKLILDDNVQFV